MRRLVFRSGSALPRFPVVVKRRLAAGAASTVMVLLLAAVAQSALAYPRLPSGPTFKDVPVATVKDAHGQDFPLRTNIYLPEDDPSTGPWPLVLFVHGNGGAYNFANGSRSYELSIALSQRRIAVATIDYRPTPPLPEDVYDVKAYVRFFRAHASEYNIDPNRIAVWGTSRGGHLAALLATTGDVRELEGDVGGNLDQSSRVQAAVIYYPLTDFLLNGKNYFPATFWGLSPADLAGIEEVAQREDTSHPLWTYVEVARLVNPIRYVSTDDPPMLIAVGAKDTVTPMELAWALYTEALQKGVDASFYSWSKGVHGIVGEDIERATQEWLVKKLLTELAPKS